MCARQWHTHQSTKYHPPPPTTRRPSTPTCHARTLHTSLTTKKRREKKTERLQHRGKMQFKCNEKSCNQKVKPASLCVYVCVCLHSSRLHVVHACASVIDVRRVSARAHTRSQLPRRAARICFACAAHARAHVRTIILRIPQFVCGCARGVYASVNYFALLCWHMLFDSV